MTGGFSLAAKWVWGEDHHIHSFVEIDPFCQQILHKHWPDVPIHGNIRTYRHDGTRIDLLTGGFPCQPFSVAGKRRGSEDDRWLWPEALRVVGDCKPTWVIFENVYGFITLNEGVEFDKVLSDLESQGYEVQAFIIPACGVDAPHRRDRVWIMADTERNRLQRNREGRNIGSQARNDKGCTLAGRNSKERARWLPEPAMGELVNGVSGGLVRFRGRVAKGIPNRVNKLKALGNAVVVPLVCEIMEAIKDLEEQSNKRGNPSCQVDTIFAS